jgi:transposase-like protein
MQKMIKEKGRKGQYGGPSKYERTFKLKVVKEFMEGDQSLRQIARQFGISTSAVSIWFNKYSSDLTEKEKIINVSMTEEEQSAFDALQKQMEGLQKKLDYEQMKNFALETMIDLAKEELGVDIRKNSGAKQPKE